MTPKISHLSTLVGQVECVIQIAVTLPLDVPQQIHIATVWIEEGALIVTKTDGYEDHAFSSVGLQTSHVYCILVFLHTGSAVTYKDLSFQLLNV